MIVANGDGEDIAARVKDITAQSMAYAALHAVAGETSGKILSAVRPAGTLLVYGLLSGTTVQTNVTDLLFHRKVRMRESMPSSSTNLPATSCLTPDEL